MTENQDMNLEPAAKAQEAKSKNRLYRTITLFALAAAAFLFLKLYQYPLLRTYQSWNSQHGYNSNGLVIFLGGLYLFFAARKNIKAAAKNVNWFGLVLLFFGLLATLGLKRADFNAAQTVFCLFSFWSCLLYLCGFGVARLAIFPLVIMLFSVQWGLGSSIVSTHLRILSTDIACRFINFTGKIWDVQVVRQGTNVSLVNLPDVQFDVAAPCSGLQSLIMTSVLCLVMAYISLKTWWKRGVMLLLIAPIAVLNNSLRIVLIAYCGSFFTYLEHALHLSQGWGKNVAFGAFHEYPGVVVYALGFIMIFLACYILEKLPGKERELAEKRRAEKAAEKERRENGEPEPAKEEEIREDMDQGDASPYYAKAYKPALAVLALVALSFVLSFHVKENIRYTPGLAYAKIPYMVAGQTLSLQELPIITNIPLATATMRGIATPISDMELKELPEDTTYFRTHYVPKETYASYERAVSALMNPSLSDSNRYEAIRAIKSGKAVPALEATGLVLQAQSWRSNLVLKSASLGDPKERLFYMQFARMLRNYALVQIAQAHRDPGSILLAIVQNDKDHHSIHAPEACFPAQGWTVDKPTPFPVTMGGKSFEGARMDVSFKQAGIREAIIYWYQCDHSLMTPEDPLYATHRYMWLPFKTTLDLVFRGVGDRWAFVRFSNPVMDGETYDMGAARIQTLIDELEPYLIYRK